MAEFQNISLSHLYKQLIPLTKNTKIPDLEIQPNTKTTSQQEIVDLVQSFYKNLYSFTSIDENVASKFQGKNVTKLTLQQTADLEQPITLKELYDAITTMKKGKTPGLDGLSLEFYLTFYQDIKHLLLDTFNYTYSQTDHDPTLYKGIIIGVRGGGAGGRGGRSLPRA